MCEAEETICKKEIHRTRLTVGGNRIDYPGNVTAPTAELPTIKLLFNSVLSTPNAKFLSCDINNFYLNTPLTDYEYMKLPKHIIPDEIFEQYKLLPLLHRNFVYIQIRKGMYGLPQAGRLANLQLIQHLRPFGFEPVKRMPGLWKHTSRPVQFTLVVDDFGIQYTGVEHATYLLNAIKQHYDITVDWSGSSYCGLSLSWDYIARTLDVSMPGYVKRALLDFQHPSPNKPEHAPYPFVYPRYGTHIYLTPPIDTSSKLESSQLKRLQQIIGKFLYYARAVDPTMLVTLGDLDTAQTNGTQKTIKLLTHFLNYAATHPNATMRYSSSSMLLHVHSDASYLSAPKAHSRSGGFFFLSSPLSPTILSPINAPVHCEVQILKMVVASAAEAEIGALFLNGQTAVPLRITLGELGYLQPETPIQTDNSTAAGFCNSSIKQRKSKSIDMRFYWIQDRVNKELFLFIGDPKQHILGIILRSIIRLLTINLCDQSSSTFHLPSVSVQGCVILRIFYTTECAH